jgi:hypothetical protein
MTFRTTDFLLEVIPTPYRTAPDSHLIPVFRKCSTHAYPPSTIQNQKTSPDTE